MKGSYQLNAKPMARPKIDIFADKSALVLEWLLLGSRTPSLKVREVAVQTGVSLGLVQKVFFALVQKGWLKTSGLRTSKVFHSLDKGALITAWATHYNLTEKKRLYTYSSALGSKDELLARLTSSPLKKSVALALHSAAQDHGRAFSNIKTLELYLLKPELRASLEKLLQLEPQERGFEVLLVEPYYKAMLLDKTRAHELSWKQEGKIGLESAPPLLSYLDLNQYPLRGHEQAEYLLKTELKGLLRG